jgi:predicted nuclease with RNAse H fold
VEYESIRESSKRRVFESIWRDLHAIFSRLLGAVCNELCEHTLSGRMCAFFKKGEFINYKQELEVRIVRERDRS